MNETPTPTAHSRDAIPPTVPALVLVMAGWELTGMLRLLLPHWDKGNPALDLAEIEVDGAYLYLAATDRFTLAVVRRRLPDVAAPLRIAVPLARLSFLRRAVTARDQVQVTVSPSGMRAVVHQNDHPGCGCGCWAPEHTLRIMVHAAGPFPEAARWRTILAKSGPPVSEPPALNLALLARFRRGGPVRVRHHEKVTVVSTQEVDGITLLGLAAHLRPDPSWQAWDPRPSAASCDVP